MENYILWSFLVSSVMAAFVWIRKKPIKDWLLVFFLSGCLGIISDTFLVETGHLEYPVRLFPQIFHTCVLFDVIVFPTILVFLNQTSYRSSMIGIVTQTILYAIPTTALESFLENQTRLIVYHDWTWVHSFISLVTTALLIRGIMGIIRRGSKE